MKCPHCHKDIRDTLVLSAAGRIAAKHRRPITSQQARWMQKKSVEARKRKREDSSEA